MADALQLLRADISRCFRAPEGELLPKLIEYMRQSDHDWHDNAQQASKLIAAERNAHDAWLANLLHEYPLNSHEGRALLSLAECSLRIPDWHTRQQLIRDKLSRGQWRRPPRRRPWQAQLGIKALGLSHALLRNSPKTLQHLITPAITSGVLLAMRQLGSQFVFAHHIDNALRRARSKNAYCSFDMLGEAACTTADAERYLHAYRQAIIAVGRYNASHNMGAHSVSIKLSALHPRYEMQQATRTLPMLLARVRELASLAQTNQVALTIDAEESERLELSLALIEQLLQTPALRHWSGLSVAVQAYQKRALPVISWLDALAQQHQCRIGVRLVKGAYWDSEIKRCQERGLSDFPVFTRKASTDVSYLACARQLLASERLVPAFATHNALTIATLLSWIGLRRDVEFQRLHGMNEHLYEQASATHGILCRVYSPVGRQHDLLPYLIRRMLENSNNSGFVYQMSNSATPLAQLLLPPHEQLRDGFRLNAHIQAPEHLFKDRRNSIGLDLHDRQTLDELNAHMQKFNAVTFMAHEVGPSQ
jgi:RHH-type transcriptional regulator, proline utilization regulon repressor / proline dehydrogenase / delta 1-pyrroline-5-carboxylate dehydrogenase